MIGILSQIGSIMSYRYDVSFFIDQIISLKQTFVFSSQRFTIKVFLRFCLIFCQFQPGVAHESVAK